MKIQIKNSCENNKIIINDTLSFKHFPDDIKDHIIESLLKKVKDEKDFLPKFLITFFPIIYSEHLHCDKCDDFDNNYEFIINDLPKM